MLLLQPIFELSSSLQLFLVAGPMWYNAQLKYGILEIVILPTGSWLGVGRESIVEHGKFVPPDQLILFVVNSEHVIRRYVFTV